VRTLAGILLAISAMAGAARADAPADAPPPPIVLAPGVVIARIAVESGVAPWAPVSIAPDVWVGATDRITLGATSSEAARDWVGAGRGVCVHRCLDVYGGAAADARFRLRDGDVAIAGRGAIDFRGFGPGVVALELGAVLRSRAGALVVTIAPYLTLGIVNASLDNHASVVVPLELAWDVGRVRIAARTGARGEVSGFFATAQVPLAAAIDVGVGGGVAVGVGAGLPRALGAASGLDARVADVHVTWRP
jgi:hypothetical protein